MLCRQVVRPRLQRGHKTFLLLGLLALALSDEHADLLGRGVLLRKARIQLGLYGLASVVQLLDLGYDGGGINALLGKPPDGRFLVVPDLLECQHNGYSLLV